jgi:hypothetical protein
MYFGVNTPPKREKCKNGKNRKYVMPILEEMNLYSGYVEFSGVFLFNFEAVPNFLSNRDFQ